jgi:hypothetical protein
MVLHCAHAKVEEGSDFFVAPAFSDQLHDLAFARAETLGVKNGW